MKNLKKLFCGIMALILVFTLLGCNQEAKEETGAESTAAAQNETTAATQGKKDDATKETKAPTTKPTEKKETNVTTKATTKATEAPTTKSVDVEGDDSDNNDSGDDDYNDDDYSGNSGSSYVPSATTPASTAAPTAAPTTKPTEAPATKPTTAPTTAPTTPPTTAHSHNYTASVTAPTCTEAGFTTYVCSCGDSYTGDEVSASGHSWGDWVTTQEPTTDYEGIEERSCSVCGETETSYLDRLPGEYIDIYELASYGMSYGAGAYGFIPDYSCYAGYYPACCEYFTTMDAGRAAVCANVDATANQLIAASGDITGARINIGIEDAGDGWYWVYVYYG